MTVRGLPAVGPRPIRGLPPAILLVLLPVVKYGLALRSEYAVLTLVVLVVAYGMAIYLYQAVALLTCAGRNRLVVISALVALAAGLAVCPAAYRVMMLGETVMIPAAGTIVGWRLRAGDSCFRAYVLGTVAVIVGGIIMFAPTWSRLMMVFEMVGQEGLETFSSSLTTLGYHPAAAAAYVAQLEQVVHAVTRMIPAATVMNLVAQFSVGFLWLLWRGFSGGSGTVLLEPFARWKVPFALTPVLIVAALGRLLGGEQITLVADNLLMALSIFYCVGGLALLNHVLGRLKLPLGIRVLFYIVLTFTGLLGFLVTVLLGFIDSFADWRKVSRQSIELDKS